MARIAFLFPGQGSQTLGMGREFFQKFKTTRDIFDQSSTELGYDLSKVCFEGPLERLNQTEYTQPALLTTCIAICNVVRETVVHPEMVAGHSLGEYTAIVASGGFEASKAAVLVRERGRYMQEAVPEGKGLMAAVLGLGRLRVQEICNKASEVGIVSAANYNSPEQIVIAGARDAVESAMTLAKEAGAKRIIPIPISVPSHCSLMKPACERLGTLLNTIPIGDLKIPVVTNADAEIMTDSNKIRQSLTRQLELPLLWEESIQVMALSGIDLFVEIGPGRVLSGLVKRIVSGVRTVSIADVKDLDALRSMVGA